MSRFAAKTYTRSVPKETQASKAFDDVVKDVNPPMARRTYSKWGNTAYTSARTGGGIEECDTKRRKVENEDPFSFDTDEEASPRKKFFVHSRSSGNSVNSDKCIKTQSQSGSKNDKSIFSHGASKTYSKPVNKNGTKSSLQSTYGKASGSSRSLKTNEKQLSMDIFASKSAVTRLADEERVPIRNSVQSKPPRIFTRKFFSSSQNSTGSTEALTSDSPVDTSQEVTNQPHSEIWDSDDNSDISIPDSGDPEIIFSPRKKKNESQNKTDMLVDTEADTPPSSPVSDWRTVTTCDHTYYSPHKLDSDADDKIVYSEDKSDLDDHTYYSRKENVSEEDTDVAVVNTQELKHDYTRRSSNKLKGTFSLDRPLKKKKVPTATLR